MGGKKNNALKTVSKILISLLLISLLGYLGYIGYVSIKSKPYKVRVTNVTDSAFTVSWITDKPMVGVVYYDENNDFLPGPLVSMGKKVAVDDRDMSKAQTECVEKFTEKASKTKDENFVVDVSGFNCEDVKVTKYGKYYTHHVTVENLEPEKTYYFRIGNGITAYSKNNGVYTENELPGIDMFLAKTRNVFTEVGTPYPAFGSTYNLYYDKEKNLVKNVSFDSLMFLLAKKDGVVLSQFSGVANSDGGWSIDLGNIRDLEGNIIERKDGIELEFIPQTENFLPANRKVVSLNDVESPLLMVGNNHDTWEEPEKEKQGSVSSERGVLDILKHKSLASSDTRADGDTDEMIVTNKVRDCLDPDGCVCLFDKQGNNYMIRIDVKKGEKCSPKTVCKGKDKWPGKMDIQMGDMCIDPSGCECFNGSTYANKDAECGCECGREDCVDSGGDTITCWNDQCESKETPVFGGNPSCDNFHYPSKEKPAHCTDDDQLPPGNLNKGTYTSLVDLCGEFYKPAFVRYKGYKEGKENVLVCLSNSDYDRVKGRCKDGMGQGVLSAHWKLNHIIENSDGTYSLGEEVVGTRNTGSLLCPKVSLTLAIDIDTNKGVKEQAEAYTKYKCCVTEDSDRGVFGYKYSFQKDCSVVADAEKCDIPLKSSYCIDSKEPNLLFAVLYAQSKDNRYNNDKTVCEEEGGEGLRGSTGYGNETPHYGKNCCEKTESAGKTYQINRCANPEMVRWKFCIDNGKVGDVFHPNPIRYDEFRLGGKSDIARFFEKLKKPVLATIDTASLEEGIETVFFFPESGMYEVNTYGGGQTLLMGDKDTSYFYFKNRDGIEGYQAPADPANPKENEDIIVPRVIAEVSVSRTTTGKEIELKKGVNIISLDFLPTKSGNGEKLSSGDFLSLANASGRKVSSISQFVGGQWQRGTSYDFEKEKITGPLFDLIFGKGYVVIAEEDTTITVPGQDVKSPVPIAFSSGWNLIGVHGYDTQYTAKSFVNSINSIEGIQANNVTYWPTSKGMYQGFQLSQGQEYGQDFPISKDLGYFVRINDIKKDCRSIWWNPGGQKNGECN